jgi:hypothetical protein
MDFKPGTRVRTKHDIDLSGGTPGVYDEPIIKAGTIAIVASRSDTDYRGRPMPTHYLLKFDGFGTSLPAADIEPVP